MDFRKMLVEGHEVTPAQQEAASRTFIEALERSSVGTFGWLKRELIKQGVPPEPSHRATDRLLQKLRKAGYIAASRSGWRLGGTPFPPAE